MSTRIINFRFWFLWFTFISILLQPHLLAAHGGPEENIGGFIAGTLVHTADGQDTIQNIKINDQILSYDFVQNAVVESKVTKVHVFQVDAVVHISIGGEELFTNPDHRFYNPIIKDWTPAKSLVANQSIVVGSDGRTFKIDKVELVEGRETLYELSVERTENYFVGENRVLVHNFVFIIPVATWVIGEGVFWASAATLAVAVGVIFAAEELGKNSSNAPAYRSSGSLEVGDTIDFSHFSDRQSRSGQTAILCDPKTGDYLERDVAGDRGHGGSYWKLKDKKGNRKATISKEGKVLRK